MKIEYLGHACLKITSVDGELVIDPYKDESVDGLAPLRVTADKVICTHGHDDHSGTECVTLSGKECTMAINTFHTWHDDQFGKLRGPNKIYLIESEGFKVAHLGDLGCALDDIEKSALQNVDVLMIPVGGYFTIDAKQAAEIVELLQPKCVIPMHYRGEGFGYRVLAPVDTFLNLVGDYERTDKIISVGEKHGVVVPAF